MDDKLNYVLTHAVGMAALLMVFVGMLYLLSGCSTVDREMMEWEGDYDCVVLSDKRVFCK